MQKKTNVALVQLCSSKDPAQNLNQALHFIHSAKRRGADIVALPETFLFLVENKKASLASAETLEGPSVKALSDAAKKLRIWIHCGSLLLKKRTGDRRVRNTSILFSSDGKIRGTYEKIHLFDVKAGNRHYRESETCLLYTSPSPRDDR